MACSLHLGPINIPELSQIRQNRAGSHFVLRFVAHSRVWPIPLGCQIPCNFSLISIPAFHLLSNQQIFKVFTLLPLRLQSFSNPFSALYYHVLCLAWCIQLYHQINSLKTKPLNPRNDIHIRCFSGTQFTPSANIQWECRTWCPSYSEMRSYSHKLHVCVPSYTF